MTKSYPRFTLADSIKIEGPGLHYGEPVAVTLHPGESGFAFRLGGQRIEAHPSEVTDTRRCTQLGSVATVEHVLSALAGMGVTDAEIEVEGGELPACDGCSLPYVHAIQSAGLASCGSVEVEGPFARVFLQDLPIKIAIGRGEGWWRCIFELDGYAHGRQEVELAWSPEAYAREIAPARTVVLEEELPMIKAAGLGKGLSEESCLAIGRGGFLNEPRFADEPTRHKLLDLIGDLALSGVPIAHLDVVGERCGHASNVRAAQKLVESVAVTRRG